MGEFGPQCSDTSSIIFEREGDFQRQRGTGLELSYIHEKYDPSMAFDQQGVGDDGRFRDKSPDQV